MVLSPIRTETSLYLYTPVTTANVTWVRSNKLQSEAVENALKYCTQVVQLFLLQSLQLNREKYVEGNVVWRIRLGQYVLLLLSAIVFSPTLPCYNQCHHQLVVGYLIYSLERTTKTEPTEK